MSSFDIVKYGLTSGLCVAGITWVLNNISTVKQLLKLNQEQQINNINEIDKKQKEIIQDLNILEKTSEETKQKIKLKLNQTSNDIKQILNEDDINKIDDQVKSDWNNL